MTPAQWEEKKRIQRWAANKRIGEFVPNPSIRWMSKLDDEVEQRIRAVEAGAPAFTAMALLEKRAELMQAQTFQMTKRINEEGAEELDLIIHAEHDNIDIGELFSRMTAARERDARSEEAIQED